MTSWEHMTCSVDCDVCNYGLFSVTPHQKIL